jgi:hypothetical protein
MHIARWWLLGSGMAIVLTLTGCARDPGADQPNRAKRNYPSLLARRETPAGPDAGKPVDQLRVPEGFTGQVEEAKLPVQTWEKYRTYPIGTFVDYQLPSGQLHREVFDLADHGMMIKTRFSVTSTGFTREDLGATRLLFTGQTGMWPLPAGATGVMLGESPRVVKVGEKEITADMLFEAKEGDKVKKIWTSQAVPLGGILVVEDADGMVLEKLVDFGVKQGE